MDKIIIKLTNQGVYLNNQVMLSWNQTNFPNKDNFGIQKTREVFWEGQLVEEKKDSLQGKKYSIKIEDYSCTDANRFIKQEIKWDINRLDLIQLNIEKVKSILTYFRPLEFEQMIGIKSSNPKSNFPLSSFKKPKQTIDFTTSVKDQIRLKLNFEQPIKKVTFYDGYISFTKYFKEIRREVELRIINSNILAEFEHVKQYLYKVFKKRTVNISGEIIFENEEEVSRKITSIEIDKIDDSIVEKLEEIILTDTLRNPEKRIVNVCSEEELLKEIDTTIVKSLFDLSEQSLIDRILNLEEIRNRNQLKYLSGKLQSEKEKVRFTLVPKFGFIFYVEGQKQNHFIWELLKTNASYVWSYEKGINSFKKILLELETEISFITTHGRMKYLRKTKNENFLFSKIVHTDLAKNDIDSFRVWKDRIENVLI